MNGYVTLTGRIDRRSPRNKGEVNNPIERQNLLSRDGRNKKMRGTERLTTTPLSAIPTWLGRYYSIETGVESPKTFCYTRDGKMHKIDHKDGSHIVVEDEMALNARIRSQSFKLYTITTMYVVDGVSLWSFNGNNSNEWVKEKLEDIDGNSVEPVDIVEHKDRLCILTPTTLKISANLDPTNFSSADDSLETVVGSGKGRNIAFGKILNQETLYIFTTEGIFGVFGDTISAVASTWEVRLVEEKRAITTGAVVDVERAINFVSADGEGLELWSFDGQSSKLLSYSEKLADSISPEFTYIENMTMAYEDNYCKLSFTENGGTYNNMEVWWDAIENKIDFVKGRNVSCYLKVDTSVEKDFKLIGRSDSELVMWADRGRNYDGNAIELKLGSRDITPGQGRNVRFTAFRPEIESTGERDVFFRYLLDGRLSDLGGETTVSTTLGLTTAGSHSNSYLSDIYVVYPVTAVYGGTISSVMFYGRSAGNTVTPVIYNTGLYGLPADVDGPEATGPAVTLSTSNAWHTLPLTTPLSVQPGAKYWIGVKTGSSVSNQYMFYDDVSGVTTCWAVAGAAWTELGDRQYSFYVTYTGNITEEVANWNQDLSGEAKTLGFIRINNQSQFIDRVQPRINYARGTSVSFQMYSNEVDSEFSMLGIGYDFVDKGDKKGKKIGA